MRYQFVRTVPGAASEGASVFTSAGVAEYVVDAGAGSAAAGSVTGAEAASWGVDAVASTLTSGSAGIGLAAGVAAAAAGGVTGSLTLLPSLHAAKPRATAAHAKNLVRVDDFIFTSWYLTGIIKWQSYK